MATKSPDVYKCNICNKEYKFRQSLWKHNVKKHIGCSPPKDVIVRQKAETTRPVNQLLKSEINKNSGKYSCDRCGYEFTRPDSLKKHYNRCRIDSSLSHILSENKELKNIIMQQSNSLKQYSKIIKNQTKDKKQMEKKIDKIESLLSKLMNKKEVTSKIDKQQIGDHNTINENVTNTENNITNNNYIIALGHENLSEIFTKKEKLKILNSRFNSLPFLIEYAHFNDNYPQFKNVLITNTQNNLAYKYDNNKKQFIAIDKNELLDDILDQRICDIYSFYDELEDELDERTKSIINEVREKIDTDPEYKELKKKDIKLILYNNRKKVPKEKLNIEL